MKTKLWIGLTLVGILSLSVLDSDAQVLPSEPTYEKPISIDTTTLSQEHAKLETAKLTLSSSENFSILFNAADISKDTVYEFLKTLEYGRKKILEWGFEEPSFMKTQKLNIYLIPQEKFGGPHAGFFRRGEDTSPFIELAIMKSRPLVLYQATLFHELFHAFQHGYGEQRNKWFTEATADAIQDELLLSLGETPHYVQYDDRHLFLFSWQRFGFDSLEGDHEYYSSIFFSYLIHEFKDAPVQGISILKELWKTKPTPEDNVYRVLEKVLGEEQFKNAFHYFSVSLIAGSEGQSPLSFPKPSIPFIPLNQLESFSQELIPHHGYLERWDPVTGTLTPQKFSLDPYTAHYLYFSWNQTDGIEESLYCSLSPPPGYSFFSNAVAKDPNSTVTFHTQENHAMVIPRFLNPDARKHVILVLTNPSPLKTEVSLTASYGSPPYLKKIKVQDTKKNRTVYEALWKEESSKTRKLEEGINALELENRKKISLSFEVLFSKKIHSSKLTIENKEYLLRDPKNEGLLGYRYKIDPVSLEPRELQKKISLVFEGQDEKENHLDSKPQTIPRLKTTQWEHYESEDAHLSIGGKDKSHAIKIDPNPPYVTDVKAQEKGNIFYHAYWKTVKDKREFTFEKNLPLNLKENPNRAIQLTFTFSKKIYPRPLVRIGEYILTDFTTPDEGQTWITTLHTQELPSESTRKPTLPLRIDVGKTDAQLLDSDPQTLPHWDDQTFTWSGYEEGEDLWHKLNLQGDHVIRGQVLQLHSGKSTPVSGATVLGFVEYWTASKEKIQKKNELMQKLYELAQKKQISKDRITLFKPMLELDLSIKQEGHRWSGGRQDWKTTTDAQGKFEIKGITPYDPDTMYDIFYHAVAFKEGYGAQGPLSWKGLGNPRGKLPETFFTLYLYPGTPGIAPDGKTIQRAQCQLLIEPFSGNKLVQQQPSSSAWIETYWTYLFKNTVNEDEIIFHEEFPFDHKEDYTYDMSKLSNRLKYREKINKLKVQFPNISIIEAFPLTQIFQRKGLEPKEIFIGYQFSSELKDYFILKYQCQYPIARPPADEPSFLSIREAYPPFIKAFKYFKDLEGRIEHMKHQP